MGAIVAILGEAGDPELGERLDRMLARSPYRGTPRRLVEGPLAVGIQTLGWDASLASVGNWIVAFHGYVGNWKELAAERSWIFPPDAGDAHRLAVAWEDLGEDVLPRLRGEWALLVWDRRERVLTAARDVVGCRPLYSTCRQGRAFLATEVRQVLAGSKITAEIHLPAVAGLLLFRPVDPGSTCHAGVRKVPGGHALRFPSGEPGLYTEGRCFWSPPESRFAPGDLDAGAEELRELLECAVIRSRAPVPAALAMSGGLDSGGLFGTITRLVRLGKMARDEVKPFSNVYPGLQCDESALIHEILRYTGAEGSLVDTSRSRASQFLEDLLIRLDFPHFPNVFPNELLLAAMQADGRQVEFVGLGGDEWLTGSFGYLGDLFWSGRVVGALTGVVRARIPSWQEGFVSRLRWLRPSRGFLSRLGLSRFRRASLTAVVSREYRDMAASVGRSIPSRYGVPEAGGSVPEFARMLSRLDAQSTLEITEQQAAFWGVEIRYPYMDLDIVEFGIRTPDALKTAGWRYKGLLRQAVGDVLPLAVTERVEPTVFTDLFDREERVLEILPRAGEWLLVQTGVLDGAVLDGFLSRDYTDSLKVHVLTMWWVEEFLRWFLRSGRFRDERQDDDANGAV